MAISLSIAPIDASSASMRDQRPERDPHAVGNHNLAVFVEPVDGQPRFRS
jgi:hypothetical protein